MMPSPLPKVYSTCEMIGHLLDNLKQSCEVHSSLHPFPSHQDILDDVRGGVDVIYCAAWDYIDDEILEAAGPILKAVCSHSAGLNNIDIKACQKRNIRIGYAGNLVAGCTAEYALGMMIAVGRRIKKSISYVSRGIKEFPGCELDGFQLMDSTVGIVGLGFIGQELAKRIQAFDVERILYTGPRRKKEGDALGLVYTEFKDLLQQSDFVVACCALNGNTKNLFNKEAFQLMKNTAVFINISRGSTVDQDALYEALSTRRIFAAGLDVTTPEPLPVDHPLISLENCLILPHLATLSCTMQQRLAKAVFENILGGITGGQMACELTPSLPR